MANMTPKQKRFCDEYLIDLNATQAAIRAGYSEKTAKQIGQRLLTNVDLKNYIGRKIEQIESQKVADAREVMEYLTSVLRGTSEAEIVVVENVGDYKSKARKIRKAPDEKERLKAAELLGKRYGLYTEEKEKEARIEKLRAETARIKGEDPDENALDDGFLDALRGEAQSVWEEG